MVTPALAPGGQPDVASQPPSIPAASQDGTLGPTKDEVLSPASSEDLTATKPPDDGHNDGSETFFDHYLWNPLSGLVLAVLGMIAYDRLRRRIKVQYVSRHKDQVVQEVHDLYLERIDPSERVPPTYVTHCLRKPESCIQHERHLRELADRGNRNGCDTMHLLLAAWCYGEVVGILKGMYIRRARMLYVAYAAVSAENPAIQRRVFPLLLWHLQTIVSKCSGIDWLVFETTTANGERSNAKDKLFRHHAERFGVELRLADCEYLQPDLEYPVQRTSTEQPANLYIGATRTRTGSHMKRETFEQILSAIYFDVYLATWNAHHPDANQDDLREYVVTLRDIVLSGLPPNVMLK